MPPVPPVLPPPAVVLAERYDLARLSEAWRRLQSAGVRLQRGVGEGSPTAAAIAPVASRLLTGILARCVCARVRGADPVSDTRA